MGDKCCRSVTTKVRIEERAQPFGDWLVPLLNVLGESFRAEVGASNLTRLFVVFIALDAFSEVILESLSNSKIAKQFQLGNDWGIIKKLYFLA